MEECRSEFGRPCDRIVFKKVPGYFVVFRGFLCYYMAYSPLPGTYPVSSSRCALSLAAATASWSQRLFSTVSA